MNDKQENYSYTLTTLSPLHIGTGEEMPPIEFYIDETQNRIIVPDLQKVFEEIRDEKQIKRVVEDISKNSNNTLDRVLKVVKLSEKNWSYATKALNNSKLYSYALSQIKIDESKNVQSKTQVPKNLKLFIKNSNYQSYIPGSSIKGALRMAWLYEQCSKKQNKEILKEVLRDSIKESEEETKRKNRDEKNVNQTTRIADANINRQFVVGKPQPPIRHGEMSNYDFFRALQVSDTNAVDNDKSMGIVIERILTATVGLSGVTEKSVNSIFDGRRSFLEIISSETSFIGRISFNQNLLKSVEIKEKLGWAGFPDFSIEKLCKAVNLFARDVCNWEAGYFWSLKQTTSCNTEKIFKAYEKLTKMINDAPANTAYLSLGHGSGWHKFTLGTLLIRNPEMRELLNEFGIDGSYRHPKTRKLPMESEFVAGQVFGWVKIEFEKI